MIFTFSLQQINFAFFLYSLMTTYEQQYAPLHTDIKAHGWWHWLPTAWHPFIYLARLDRPIGWWLLLLQVGGPLALARHHLA